MQLPSSLCAVPLACDPTLSQPISLHNPGHWLYRESTQFTGMPRQNSHSPHPKVTQSETKHTDVYVWDGTHWNKTQATRNTALSLCHDVTLNTVMKTKHEQSVTNWSLWWAAAKAKLRFGYTVWGAQLIPTAQFTCCADWQHTHTSPVDSGSCVGNTALAFNDRFQTFVYLHQIRTEITKFMNWHGQQDCKWCAACCSSGLNKQFLAFKTAPDVTVRK